VVLTRYFEGLNQALQLMCSSYLSKSILESAPTFSSISLITSCSSGGRRMSPRLRLKYWLRPKWSMSVVMNWVKVPMKLKDFCEELNKRRKAIDTTDDLSIYELSFWAHYELVTIHPWADGNGRTSRLLMNLLQMEYDVLPTKVYKEDKAEYIQALIDTREAEDTDIFINCMAKLHCEHLQQDIDHFLISTSEKMVDKTEILQEMVDKWSIKPTLAGKLADIIVFMADKEEIRTEQLVTQLGLTETTAKRYLRQLTDFGYLESHGGNRNKSYTKKV
jgi:Fic family protein